MHSPRSRLFRHLSSSRSDRWCRFGLVLTAVLMLWIGSGCGSDSSEPESDGPSATEPLPDPNWSATADEFCAAANEAFTMSDLSEPIDLSALAADATEIEVALSNAIEGIEALGIERSPDPAAAERLLEGLRAYLEDVTEVRQAAILGESDEVVELLLVLLVEQPSNLTNEADQPVIITDEAKILDLPSCEG